MDAHILEFREHIASFGITAPLSVIPDGKIHRFSSSGRKGDESGWYVFHVGEISGGAFGCWRSCISEKWTSKSSNKLTQEEKDAWKEKKKLLDKERVEEEKRARKYAVDKSHELIKQAKPAENHPYLIRKKIPHDGIVVFDHEILIPMRDGVNSLVGLQRIAEDGTKKFLYGTPPTGAYAVIGIPKLDSKIVICEGYATGSSIHQSTGFCVVVAFTAGNLEIVSAKIKAAMPDSEIIIAADDDWKTEINGKLTNVGLIAAEKSAKNINARLVIPSFGYDRQDKWTDFNDQFCAYGASSVMLSFMDSPHAELETEDDEDTDEETPPLTNVYPDDPPIIKTSGFTPKIPRYKAVAAYNLDAPDSGVPHSTIANVVRVLSGDQNLSKKIFYDEFLQKVMTTIDGKAREWSDIDDINLQIYLQDSIGMSKLSKATTADAVMAVAYQDTRNECISFIKSIEWDGVERLPSFLSNVYGVEDTEYHRGVGQVFWISMIARVIRPGCQVRTMIVLEGLQNAGKSKSLSIIGGDWFAEANSSPNDKDFYLNLQGKMLVEIGEMDAFNRADVTKIKQVITCQKDRYRMPYGRRAEDHPRNCIFAGTTNQNNWNKDETGGTRFLPVSCIKIDLDYLQKNREQLFAEAYSKYQSIPEYWKLVPDEDAKREQEERREKDELEISIYNWSHNLSEITIGQVMTDLLEMELYKQDKFMEKRIIKCLHVLGWKPAKNPTSRNGKRVRLWINPDRGEAL